MKKRDLANLTLSVLSVPALVASVATALTFATDEAVAAVGCTQGTTTTAITCSGIATGFLARDLNFTGSVGVVIQTAEDATGFGACAGHVQGSGNMFGLTTMGGSLETITGTPGVTPTAANITGGGC